MCQFPLIVLKFSNPRLKEFISHKFIGRTRIGDFKARHHHADSRFTDLPKSNFPNKVVKGLIGLLNVSTMRSCLEINNYWRHSQNWSLCKVVSLIFWQEHQHWNYLNVTISPRTGPKSKYAVASEISSSILRRLTILNRMKSSSNSGH